MEKSQNWPEKGQAMWARLRKQKTAIRGSVQKRHQWILFYDFKFWQKSLIKIYSYIWARETLLPQSTESLKSVPKNWQILMPDLVHYIYCLYTWYLPILLPKPKTSQCWIVQAV